MTVIQKMIFNRCGKSGIKLPAISLGLWHNFGGVDQPENFRSILWKAFDSGITHFDLANNYGPPPGSAEENFGSILKKILSRIGMKSLFPPKRAISCGRALTANGDQESTSSPALSKV